MKINSKALPITPTTTMMMGREEWQASRLTREERVHTCVFDTSQQASALIASEIALLIRTKASKGETAVLGLATGSSPVGVYQELVRLHREEGLSFANVVTFNLDEYYPMDPTALQSYVRFMKENLFQWIDIPPENINIPDGTVPRQDMAEYCRHYEDKIRDAGGLDLQLLGIGRTGHIGFNEPGSPLDSTTRLISLDHVTRLDAASDFFGLESVPRKAITMGIGTILNRSKRCIVMAWGEGKASIVKRAIEGPIGDHVPATYLQEHPNATFFLEASAAAQLARIQHPWKYVPVEWDDKTTKKAVIWLATKLEKAILKLTERDYMDHGMADLILDHDSAYNLNKRVFSQLQHTITGWPGGKPNEADTPYRPERNTPTRKRVLIFSPHPDDDVISMGGTFQRLVDQGHDVSVAYMTSGNIAVFDDDVLRFADFVGSVHQHPLLTNNNTSSEDSGDSTGALYQGVVDDITNKQPGDLDTKRVLTMKGLIRQSEARAACRYVGIKDLSKVNFLELPFYETGTVQKLPPGKADLQRVMDLIVKLGPLHQIYAAGDLSDPHGTHRVCLQLIFRALDALKKEGKIDPLQSWVWLYRGAWQEYPLHEIDMAVPLSPDEVARKRNAIFKHQSQKDCALFPGADPREFWQRAEDRNANTAQAYDQLGMAEYQAIEAFQRYHY